MRFFKRKPQRRQMATPRGNEIDRRLRDVRAGMSHHLLDQPVRRKTPAKSREQLASDWNARKRLAGVSA